jgi:hypothetical protein
MKDKLSFKRRPIVKVAHPTLFHAEMVPVCYRHMSAMGATTVCWVMMKFAAIFVLSTCPSLPPSTAPEIASLAIVHALNLASSARPVNASHSKNSAII